MDADVTRTAYYFKQWPSPLPPPLWPHQPDNLVQHLEALGWLMGPVTAASSFVIIRQLSLLLSLSFRVNEGRQNVSSGPMWDRHTLAQERRPYTHTPPSSRLALPLIIVPQLLYFYSLLTSLTFGLPL